MCQILDEAQKPLNLKVMMRCFPLSYTCHLITIGMKVMVIDHVAKTLQFLSIQFTLLSAKIKYMFPQLVKHKSQVFLMFLDAIAVYKDIIKVNIDKYSNVVLENRVHQSLKG